MNKAKVQEIVNEIVLEAKNRYRHMNRATKKSQARIRELGLAEYLPAWTMRDGAKADTIINAVIDAAEDAGGKVVVDNAVTRDFEGDYSSYTTQASALWLALNPDEAAGAGTISVYISAVDTDYTDEMPLGNIEVESIEALAEATEAEVEQIGDSEYRLTCEWGNGEGHDQYLVTVQ